MNKNKFFVFLVSFVFCFSFAFTASALTVSRVEDLIKLGLIPQDKIPAARAAATPDKTTTGTTNPSTNNSSTSTDSAGKMSGSCLRLSTDLTVGMTGTAVSALQDFLRNQKYLDIEKATGYFGDLTRQAVVKFQQAKGIDAIGRVGPMTKKTIEQITCGGVSVSSGNLSSGSASSTNDFFGYNLDDLFNYSADLSYSADFDYDPGASYQYDFNYKADFKYKAGDDYDADFDYDLGDDYKANFNYSSSNQDPIVVALYVKAVNGEYLRGGNSLPVAVSSRDIELKWKSTNADTCTLTGDFPEREKDVPENGTASLYLVNPSYEASNGDPMFGFRISCSEDSTYGDIASDIALVWIASSTASGN